MLFVCQLSPGTPLPADCFCKSGSFTWVSPHEASDGIRWQIGHVPLPRAMTLLAEVGVSKNQGPYYRPQNSRALSTVGTWVYRVLSNQGTRELCRGLSGCYGICLPVHWGIYTRGFITHHLPFFGECVRWRLPFWIPCPDIPSSIASWLDPAFHFRNKALQKPQ